ncbi:hypothetical protein Ocin01_09445 [Orchesella cincta]|uniref:Uncharacterized protein n=1 Tax=Orchesella cincta TaxID=48709 RepID=A0A1D2MW68_ORCCI|nr:hypothetical protein Ocin01_09445 [Orchesella cincta]
MDRVNETSSDGKVCVHVIAQQDTSHLEDNQNEDNIFTFPFRQTFFRYSLYGISEVVRSNSFVYASHHPSESDWLHIRKLSVALVGNNEIPNLALFSPTVREVYFMGHITYPITAFRMLPQLRALQKVSFNIGLGGVIGEFHETVDEFLSTTPAIPNVTSLEIKMNRQLYQGSSERNRGIFDKIIESVLKHSSDSFPNLQEVAISLPHSALFFESVVSLIQTNENLSRLFETKIIRGDSEIQVSRKSAPPPSCLPFDPCARFPSTSQYNYLRMIDTTGLFFAASPEGSGCFDDSPAITREGRMGSEKRGGNKESDVGGR